MELPREFLERMKRMLGGEYEDFLATYEKKRNFGLRVNTLKISAEEFADLAPFHLTPIPWIENGFYYEREDDPARHPFYHAGLYYLQEPSAMTPASVLPVKPGDRVLDLCAAPGGKATELAAKLQGEGLLVANDISASRAKALLKNLEISGVKNSFVTTAAPRRLAEQFIEAFDKILVDAPCSGEGMFRKDMASARAWSPEKVTACARAQKEILRQAVRMLRPGGMLLYSTCTFAPEEDEEVVAELLTSNPEMELLDIPRYPGFACGLSLVETVPAAVSAKLQKCVRIFPHRMGGEGHFLALLKKRGEPSPQSGPAPGREERAGRRDRRTARESIRTSRREGIFSGRDTGHTGEGKRVLLDFLREVTMPWDAEQLEVREDQAYLVQSRPEMSGGLPFLRNGLYLGEIKKNRFAPSQSLAMALRRGEYASDLNFDWRDERVYRYLRGETIAVDDMTPRREKGWQLVCVNGYPLGWGSLSTGTLKNKYHPGWRMR